jgi:hypothetical protein
MGGDADTAFELFNTITEHLETLQKWNEAMQEFLAQDRKAATLQVTL